MMLGPETQEFLRDLAANNSREWFGAQKSRYETVLKDPAKRFSSEIADRLSARYHVPVAAKIYRIHRDLRFAKDKTPYNTHLHVGFADPATGAAWMVGLDVKGLALGYGSFGFDKPGLERWREAVSGPAGADLGNRLDALCRAGGRVDAPELKRVPSPWPQDHPQAGLLRRKGLAAWIDLPTEDAYGPDAPARLVDRLAAFDPLRDWLCALRG